MKKFSNWDWRLKIVGPIMYSVAISSFFIYNFLLNISLIKLIALSIILLSYFFMLMARFQLKDKFSILPQADKGLETGGIYKYFAHPVYFFSCLAMMGICLYLSIIFTNIIVISICSLSLLLYIRMQCLRAKQEDKKLLEKYGHKYRDYKKQVIFRFGQ